MRDARLVEHRTGAAKALLLVEPDHRHLRVQIYPARMAALRCRDGALEQRGADALAPVSFQHRHAADLGALAVDHHTSGAHGSTVCNCQKMNRPPIVVVELDLDGHALLAHEDPHANRKSLRLCFVGRNLFYVKSRFQNFS